MNLRKVESSVSCKRSATRGDDLMRGRRSHATRCAIVRTGVSAIALLGASSAVQAQDAAPSTQNPATESQQTSSSPTSSDNNAAATKDDIIITGVRRALETAQSIKKNARTVV